MKLNSKYYIIAGVAVIIVAAGFLLMRSQYKTSVNEAANINPTTEVAQPSPTVIIPTEASAGAKVTQKAAVEYTDKGFVPKSITVKTGTAVIWKNGGSKSMWVASAPHPTHTDLPGFDQLKSTGTGSTYTYTFTKPGNWKYHNHVLPSDNAIVVVVEK